MTSTRHPLLVLTSGLLVLWGLLLVIVAVAAQLLVLPSMKEIVSDFGADSPLVQDVGAISVIVGAMVLLSAIVSTLLCISSVGVFLRKRIAWYVALVVMWMMTLLSAFSLLGAISSADLPVIGSISLGLIPSALILCLLYTRQVRPVDIAIEKSQSRLAMA